MSRCAGRDPRQSNLNTIPARELRATLTARAVRYIVTGAIAAMLGMPVPALGVGGAWTPFARESLDGPPNIVLGYGETLFVAGRTIQHAGGISTPHVAQWDGHRWRALGTGFTGEPLCMVVYQGHLYVGGQSAGQAVLGRWDGTAWTELGEAITGESFNRVQALSVFHDKLVVGGRFRSAGGVPASGVCTWNGEQWGALGNGPASPGAEVTALEVCSGTLFASGTFMASGGGSGDHIAQWAGEQWSAVGEGLPYEPVDLAAFDGALFATLPPYYEDNSQIIRRWDGTAWRLSAEGLTGLCGIWTFCNMSPLDLHVHENKLFVAGYWSTGMTSRVNWVARWTGWSWTELGAGMQPEVWDVVPDMFVSSMTSYRGLLVLGGNFDTAAELPARDLVGWDGSQWAYIDTQIAGLDDKVKALTLYRGALVAAGDFHLGGTREVGGVARWSGHMWEGFGGPYGVTQADGAIADVLADGDALYAAGKFRHISGTAATGVARWNGEKWLPMAEGLNGWGRSLTKHNGAVVVSGVLVGADGNSRSAILRWDGIDWSQMGSDFPAEYYLMGMASFEGSLVVGGVDATGGANATLLYTWDGHTWTERSRRAAGVINALVVHDGALIVGGSFTAIGGVAASRVARWDGHTFTPIAGAISGPLPSVIALASWDGALVIGGGFTSVGGTAAARVAVFDGAQWAPLDLGVEGLVYDLLPVYGSLWVGGALTAAGGQPASNLALWNGAPATGVPAAGDRGLFDSSGSSSNAVTLVTVAPNPANPAVEIQYSVTRPIDLSLVIRDARGRTVATVERGQRVTGQYSVCWDGRDDLGASVASGVYFVEARAGADRDVKKVVLMK